MPNVDKGLFDTNYEMEIAQIPSSTDSEGLKDTPKKVKRNIKFAHTK